ncbi:hypothetical protein J2853_003145 [Streptosporangium lutulentum]|uniref:Transposase DDE domain-containing protein n=1 Tax=Streptosporangium lutulentum TaxID=1461250 RepID=A0ABT9QCZ4_9ACTN|nr:hypothetical protein [Streptosporangium lutulentum]
MTFPDVQPLLRFIWRSRRLFTRFIGYVTPSARLLNARRSLVLGLPESIDLAACYLLQALEYFECMCRSV